LARRVQEAMLPPEELDVHGPLRVVGYCRPATTCGGDWWSRHKMSGGRLLLVVADVTGHGIPSAMITANARGALEALAQTDEAPPSPEQVLRPIDRPIPAPHTPLMSCSAALVAPPHGLIEYANAGHNRPYVFHAAPNGDRSHRFDRASALGGGSGNW